LKFEKWRTIQQQVGYLQLSVVILVTLEAEIRRILVQSQAGQMFQETLSQQYRARIHTHTHTHTHKTTNKLKKKRKERINQHKERVGVVAQMVEHLLGNHMSL
jgi:hypothetical protein